MKGIDFTKPGGFPLTEDQLDYLQTAWTEVFGAFALAGGDGSKPFAISGCVITKVKAIGVSLYDYTVTDGWAYYNGEIIRVVGGTFPGVTTTIHELYFVRSTANSALTFNDGSTPTVVLDDVLTADVTVATGTADDATQFFSGNMVPFGVMFGQNNREAAWKTLAVATGAGNGTVTGNIYYKKDFTANTLLIRGSLSCASPADFADFNPGAFALMTTLPVGYRPPTATQWFTAYYFSANSIQNVTDDTYLDRFTCGLNTAGNLMIKWIKPDALIGGYGINFNAIISLD